MNTKQLRQAIKRAVITGDRHYTKYKWLCGCGNECTTDQKKVSPDYFVACLACDEDMCRFEVQKVKRQ